MISSTRELRKSAAGVAEAAPLDYSTIAVELLRALRGSRSLAEFSRRMGYRSNVAHRWETRRSWPTASRYLQLHRRVNPTQAACFERFFQRTPSWLEGHGPESPQGVAAFLREVKGKTPISTLAKLGNFSRYQVSRWLSGTTQPSLPEFLCLVEAASRRVLDLLALCVDPTRLPSVAQRWLRLEAARAAGYQKPWSHAVLRALEIEPQPRGGLAQMAWLTARLGIDRPTVQDCLQTLESTGQVKRQRGRFVARSAIAINTSQEPALARQLKAAWTSAALERLQKNSPGNFGYSLFAISRRDLQRLRDLHLEYVRAMQELIARSQPSECVGLFCAQLLDLAEEGNALGSDRRAPSTL